MNYFYILVCMLLFSFQTLCFKLFNRNHMKNLASYFLFNTLYFGMVVVIFLAFKGIPEMLAPMTIILGITFGTLFVISIFCYMKAMETGPMSYSSLFFSLALLVPVIFGIFFWGEKISAMQFLALGLLLATFYLFNHPSGKAELNIQRKWVVYCIAAFIGNGGLMTLAKEHQVLLPGEQVTEFLIVSFGTAALLSLGLYFAYHLKGQWVGHLKSIPFVFVVLGAGITTAFGNQLTLYLNSRVPSVLQFPSINGGVVIFSAIASSLLFGEKLSRNGKAGLTLGIAALVLLSL